MIKFGKHKGKTYEYMLINETSYCIYVLNQTECSGFFKEFQDFIIKNDDKLYNIHELKHIGNIKCTDLTNYMSNDKNVINTIKNININTITKKKINKNHNIESDLFGQFIDYLIRYEICKIKNIQFKDRRTESIIRTSYTDEYFKTVELDCEKILLNLDNNDDFNENLNDNLILENIIGLLNNKLNNYRCEYDSDSDEDFNKNIIEIKKKIINNYKKELYITKSYLKLQNNDNISLNDILNISISHSICFGKIKHIDYIDFKHEIISKKEYENISEYIKEKINNSKNILLNPTLNCNFLGIGGDVDIIIDNELIDIKVSETCGININDFIQLIVYVVLYYIETNIICEKITIYNPLLGIENYMIINIDIINNFITILENYNISPKKDNFILITPKMSDIINIKNINLIHIINFIANNDDLQKYKINKKYGSKWKKIEEQYDKILNELLINIEKTYNITDNYNYKINYNKYLRLLQLEIYSDSINYIFKKLYFIYDNQLKLTYQ